MLRRIKWEESLVCGEQQFPPFFFYFFPISFRLVLYFAYGKTASKQ